MDFKRADRVAERIRADISELLLRKVNDPRIGMLVLTRVQVSDDLRNATVFYSQFGADDKRKKETLAGLRSATPFLQREVFKRLEIKASTQLYFKLDESLEKGEQALTLLRQLERERSEAAPAAPKAPESGSGE